MSEQNATPPSVSVVVSDYCIQCAILLHAVIAEEEAKRVEQTEWKGLTAASLCRS